MKILQPLGSVVVSADGHHPLSVQQIALPLDILVAEVVVEVVDLCFGVATRPARKLLAVDTAEAGLAGIRRRRLAAFGELLLESVVGGEHPLQTILSKLYSRPSTVS